MRVRLFARLREQAGTDRETVEVPRDATVADVYDALLHRHPNLESSRDGVGYVTIFNHENDAACQIAGVFEEARKLFVGLVTDRALRAMLENQNRIGF